MIAECGKSLVAAGLSAQGSEPAELLGAQRINNQTLDRNLGIVPPCGGKPGRNQLMRAVGNALGRAIDTHCAPLEDASLGSHGHMRVRNVDRYHLLPADFVQTHGHRQVRVRVVRDQRPQAVAIRRLAVHGSSACDRTVVLHAEEEEDAAGAVGEAGEGL